MPLGAGPALADVYSWQDHTGNNLDWFNGANWDLGVPPTAGDSAVINNNGNADVDGSAVFAALTLSNGSRVNVLEGGSLGSGTIDLDSGSQVFFNNTSSLSVANAFSGAGRINLSGGATYTLSGISTNSGEYLIDAAVVKAGATNAWSANASYFLRDLNGASTLDLNGFDETVGQLNGADDATLIIGDQSLTVGTGYTGVHGWKGIITGSALANLVIDGGSFVIENDNPNFLGTTTINNGALLQFATAGIGSLGGKIVDNGTLLVNNGGGTNLTVANNISGSGTVDIANFGPVLFTGNNTYTGDTTFEAAAPGTLVAGGNVAFSQYSIIQMISGATLDLNGFNSTIGGLNGTAGTVELNGAWLFVQANSDSSFGGTIEGASSNPLTKSGGGTFTLQAGATITFTGETLVNVGTLQVDADISSSSNVGVGSNGTLSGTGTVPTVAIGNGGSLNPGDGTTPGTLNIAGDLSFDPNGHMLIYVNGTAASQAAVTGAVDLSSSPSLHFDFTAPTAGVYTILTASGGITGTFNSIVDYGGLTGLSASIVYHTNEILLELDAPKWVGGTSSDWSDASNWSLNAVPTDADEEHFDNTAARTTVSLAATAAGRIGAMTFDVAAPAFTFELGSGSSAPSNLTITGAGIVDNGSNAPTFNLVDAGFGETRLSFGDFFGSGAATTTAGDAIINSTGAVIEFDEHATAGTAVITQTGASGLNFRQNSNAGHATMDGFIQFQDASSADHATINDVVQLNMSGTSTLANATVTTSSGSINFFDTAMGGSASVDIGSGASVNFSASSASTNSLGRLTGSGFVNLGSVSLNVGGTVDTGDSATFSGNISGTHGAIFKTGNGTWVLGQGGTYGYTGSTDINNGTMEIDGDISSSSQLIVTFLTTARGTGTVPLTLVNGGTLAPGTASSTGTLTVADDLTFFSGAYVVKIITADNDSTIVDGDLSIDTSTVLHVDLTTPAAGSYTILTYSGNLTGAFNSSIVYDGDGLGDLTPSLIYNAGSIVLELDGPPPPPTTFNWTGASSTLFDDAGNWDNTQPGFTDTAEFGTVGAAHDVVDVTGSNDSLGGATFDGDGYTFNLTASSGTGIFFSIGSVNDTSGQTQTFNVSGFEDGGSFLATLALSGDAPSFAVNLENFAARLDISGAGVNGAEVGSISGSGVVLLDSNTLTTGEIGTDDVFSGTIADLGDGGGLTKVGEGTLTLSGANTYDGLTTISGGALQIGDGGTSGDIAGNVQDDAELRFNFDNSYEYEFAHDISGSGAVVIAGGIVTLSGNNSYSGGTTIDGGTTLVVTSDASLGEDLSGEPVGSLIFLPGSTLRFAGDTDIHHAAEFAMGAPVFDTNGHTVTYGGQLTGVGDLGVTGGGTLILTNNGNTYQGGTEVYGGTTLEIDDDGDLGDLSGGLSLGDGSSSGTLRYDSALVLSSARAIALGAGGGTFDTNGNDTSISQGISGVGGTLTKVGSGTLTLTGDSSYDGLTTVSDGTLEIGDGGTSGSLASGTIQVDFGGTVQFNRSDNPTYAGTFTGEGEIHLCSCASETFTGDSSAFAGSLTNDGVVTFDASAASIGFGGSVSGSGSLVITGSNLVTLTSNSQGNDIEIDSGAQLSFTFTDNVLYANVLSGSGAFSLDGGTTTEMSADSSGFSGTTSVNAGTLNITGSLGGSAVTVNSGGTLTATGTAGSVHVASGGVLIQGTAGNMLSVGDLTFDTGSTYELTLDGASSGTISATGAVMLAGHLILDVTPDIYAAGPTYALISSVSNVSGTFDDTQYNGDFGAFIPHLTYNDHGGGVFLTLSAVASTFSWAATPPATANWNDTASWQDGTVPGDTDAASFGATTNAVPVIDNADTAFIGEMDFLGGAGVPAYTIQIDHSSSFFISGAGIVDLAAVPPTFTVDNSSSLFFENAASAGDAAINVSNNSSVGFLDTADAGSATVTATSGSDVSFAGSSTADSAHVVLNGGSLSVDSLSSGGISIGSLSGSDGTVVLGSNVLTVGGLGLGDVLNAGITGDAGSGLVKTGSGTLTLTGSSDYPGDTEIDDGTLQLGDGTNNGTIANSAFVVSGTLAFDEHDDQDIANSIDGTGNITVSGPGKITLTSDNPFSGTTTINSGATLQLGNGFDATGLIDGDVVDNGALIFNRPSGSDFFFSGTISGSGSVEQAGEGVAVLVADNTYTGTTTIDDGAALFLGDGSGTGAGSITSDVVDNGFLLFEHGGTYSFDNTISGTGDVEVGAFTSGDVVTFTKATTYSGETDIEGAATLRAGAANVFSANSRFFLCDCATLDLNDFSQTLGGLTGDGMVTLGSSAATTLTFAGNASDWFGGVISGAGKVTLTGSDPVIFTNANTYTGITTIGSDVTLILSDDPFNPVQGSVAGDIVDNGLIDLELSGTTDIAGSISGTGGLFKLGDGTVTTLSGANTYSGDTDIQSGTLQATSSSSFSSSSRFIVEDVFGSSILDLNGHASTVAGISGDGTILLSARLTTGTNGAQDEFDGTLSGGGGLTEVAGGTLVLTGDYTDMGAATANGVLALEGSGGTYNGAVTVAGGGIFIADATSVTLGGGITGAGDFHVEGGTAIVTGTVANTLSGVVVSSTGTLQIADGGAINRNIVLQDADSTLSFDRTTAYTYSGAVSGAGSLTKSGSGTVILTGANTYFGSTTIDAGTLQVGNGGVGGDIVSGTIVDNGILNFDKSTTFGIGTVSGTGVVEMTGSGTLDLDQTNTYSGGTVISTGRIIVSTNANLGAAAGGLTFANGGTLGAFADFTMARAITLNTGGGVIESETSNWILSGNISGVGGLTKSGSGSATLSGTNTYSGGTTVLSGTLAIGSDAKLGDVSGAVTLNGGTLRGTFAAPATRGFVIGASNGTIALDGASSIAGVISGSGHLNVSGFAPLTLSGVNTYQGGTTVSSVVLAIASDSALGNTNGSVALNFGTMRFTAAVTGAATRNYTLSGSGTFDVLAASSIAGNITGSGGFVKTGSATLTLTGAGNNWSGGTDLSGGTLQIGNGSANGSITGDILTAASTVVAFNPATSFTYGGAITGSGALQKLGAGTLVLTGASTFSGTTTISGGTLQIGNGGTTGSVTGNIVDNGTLVFDHSSSLTTYAGVISGSGGVTLANLPAGVQLTGTNTYTGGTTIIAGALQVGNGATSGSIVGDVVAGVATGNAGINFNRSDDISFGGAISGLGYVAQQGAGTLTLTGTNSYLGYTDIGQGTVAVSADSNLGADSAYVRILTTSTVLKFLASFSMGHDIHLAPGSSPGVGGTIDTNGNSVTATGVLSGNVLFKTGAGSLILTNTNTYNGGTTVSGGALQIGSGGTTGSILGSITDNGQVVFDRSDAVAFGGVISGSGSVSAIGAGTTTLTAANTYSGGTTITGGTLQLGNGGTTGAVAGGVTDNGTLAFDRSDAVIFAGVISGSGAVHQVGSGTTILSGFNTYSGVTTISAGHLQVGNGGTTGAIVGNIVDNAALDVSVSNGYAWLYGGAISGTGSFNLTGNSVVLLTGNSSYGGGTTIAAQANLYVGQFGTSGMITGNVLANGGLIFERTDDIAFAGNISGSGSVTKFGANTLQLTGANAYSGNTFVAGGTLIIGAANNIGSSAGRLEFDNYQNLDSALKITAGMTLNNLVSINAPHVTFDTNGFQLILANDVSGIGPVVKAGSGALIFTAVGTYSGGTTINAGTLQVGNGGTTGSIAGNIGDNATLVFNRSNALTFAGAISGAGTLRQAGSGNLILSGTSTFSGDTHVDSGRLSVNGSLASSTVAVASGGTLGGTGTVGATTVASGGTLASGNSIGTLHISGGLTLSAGSHDVVEVGAGVADETIAGGAVFIAGDLTLVSTGSLAAGHYTLINAAGLLTGTFSAIGTSGSFAGFSTSVTYDNHNVFLDLVQSGFAWKANPGSSDWNTGANWLPGTVPTGSDNTLFDVSTTTTILINQAAATNAMVFAGTAPAYLFIVQATAAATSDASLTVNGGINDGSANAPYFAVNGTATHHATLTFTAATSGDAILSAQSFGTIAFTGTADGAGSRVLVGAGLLDFTGVSDGAASIGSLEGQIGTVALGTATLTVGALGTDTEFNGVITGSGGLVKTGAGTLILGGNNVYTGGTTIGQGTLQISSNDGVGSILGDVTDNAALAFGSGSTMTFSGVISGSGIVEQIGTNTTTLLAANTYTGGTTISSGTLQLGDGGSTGSIIGDVVDNGTLAFDRSDAITFAGMISGNGRIAQNGDGTTTLTADNTASGTTMISAGGLQLGNGGASGSVAGHIVDNARLIVDRSDSFTLANTITGTGAFVQAGSGTTILTAANSYAGGTTISAGALQLGNGGTVGSFSGNVVDNAVLIFERSDSFVFGPLAGGGGPAIQIGGAISGSGSVVQQGTGTVTLTAANTYTGGTMISSGTLRIGNGGTVGSITGDIVDNGTLAFARSDAITFGGTISGSGGVRQTGGALTLTADNTYSGLTTIASTLQIGNGGASGAVAGDIADNGALIVDRSGTVTLGGTITGGGSVTQAGDGRTVLTAVSTYTGSTTVNGGTLSVDGSIAKSTVTVNDGATLGGTGTVGATTVASGGTLAAGDSIGTLQVMGDLTLETGAHVVAEIGPAAGDEVMASGAVFLAGDLTVVGTGGVYNAGQYTLINSAGALDGSFSALNVSGSFGGFDVSLLYDAHDVFLVLDLNGVRWSADPGSSDWNTGGNWLIGTVPTATDKAYFGASTITTIDVNQATTIAGMNFAAAAPAYTFNVTGTAAGDASLTVGGSGIGNASAYAPSFVVGGADGHSGTLTFVDVSSENTILAANAGGTVAFTGGATGGASRAIVNAGGALSIAGLTTGGMSIGSIEGAGTILLGANTLTEGSLDTSTVFSGTISGSGGLTKTGAGTLTLTGANGYTGDTTISQGTLQIGNGGTTGSIAGDVVDDGTLAFDRSDAVTFGGAVSGSGGVAQNGSGTTVLTGANSYTGTTTINAGTLQVGAGGTAGAIESTSAILDNGKLVFDVANDRVLAVAVSGSGSLALTGSATITLTANNSYSGGTAISAGRLQLGNGGTSGMIAGAVNDNGVLAFDRSDNIAFAGVISGSGAVQQNGTGIVVLTANDTYTGGTTVTAGALVLGAGGTGGSIVGDVVDNALFAVNRSDVYTFAGAISGSGGFVQAGTGTTILTGSDSYAGGTMVQAGTLQIGNGGTTGAISGDVADAGVLAFDRSDTITFGGTISGAGALAQIGSGRTILTAADGYTGGTTISAGTLQIGNGGATGAITGDVTDNGALAFDRSDAILFAGVISGSGSLQQIGGGTTVLSATDTYTGGTTISAGTLQIGNGGTTGSIAGNVVDNGTLTFARSDTLAFAGAISGTGGVQQGGSGVTVLSGVSTYSGPTNVGTGTLRAGATGVFSGASAFSVASVLDLAGFNQTIGSLSGAGTVTLANATLATGGDNSSTTFSGTISGTGGLVKAGSGAFTLTGANGYTGGTTISGGTLQLGNGGTTGSILGNVVDNGVLAIGHSDNVLFDATISGSGALVQSGTGMTALTAANSFIGGTTISAGTLILGNGGTTGSITGNVADNGALDFNRTDDLTFAGVISGSGNVAKFTGNTLILTGNDTYTGGTTIGGGTLQLGNGGTSGGIVGDVADNGTLAIDRSDTLTLAGVISGAGGLSQIGSGMTVLTGISTYSGPTLVTAGILDVNGSIANSAVTLNGGTLKGNGTVGSLNVVGGSKVAPGNSIGTLTVAGNIGFTTGTAYDVEVNAAGQGDRINAGGMAILTGGIVQVTAAPGNYALMTTYRIINANGGVSGAFDGVTVDLPFFDASLLYGVTNVDLVLRAKTVDFASLGLTPNQAAAGAGVNAGTFNSDLYKAFLNQPSTAFIPGALDALAGDVHPSLRTALLEDSRNVREAILDRLRGQGDARAVSDSTTMWLRVFSNWGDVDSDGNAGALNRSYSGIVAGIDTKVAGALRLGLAGGYTHSDDSVKSRDSKARSGDGHVAAYAGWEHGGLALRAGGEYAWGDATVTRTIQFANFLDHTSDKERQRTEQAFAEAGYSMTAGHIDLEPFGGIAWVDASSGAFHETGGLAALSGDGKDNATTFGTLGLRLATDPMGSADFAVTPRLTLAWQHAFGTILPGQTVTFESTGQSFLVLGVPLDRDALAAQLGLDIQLTRSGHLGLGYEGVLSSRVRSHAVRADFSWTF